MTGGKGRQKNDWVMVRFKRIGVDVEVDRVVKGRRNRTKIYQKSGTNIIEASRRRHTPRQKSIRALEIFRVQKLILNATS